jgi:hypothetical protein
VAALLELTHRIETHSNAILERAATFEAEAYTERAAFESVEDSISQSIAAAFVSYRSGISSAIQTLGRSQEAANPVLQREIVNNPQKFAELTITARNIQMMINQTCQPIPQPAVQDDLIPPFLRTEFVIRNFQAAGEIVFTNAVPIYGLT